MIRGTEEDNPGASGEYRSAPLACQLGWDFRSVSESSRDRELKWMHMVIDWHIHAGEAEFFERYPHYMDTHCCPNYDRSDREPRHFRPDWTRFRTSGDQVPRFCCPDYASASSAWAAISTVGGP
jgi:hypothetical protein